MPASPLGRQEDSRWELVAGRRQAGRSVLIISHFVVDEDRFDRIIDLRDGNAVPR